MLAKVISERNLPAAIKFYSETDYKSIIDAAADYISAVAFNINLYSEKFVRDAAEYAKSKGLYVLSDSVLSLKAMDAEKILLRHFEWADGVSITTFFEESDLQQIIFTANRYNKDLFIYLNDNEELIQEIAGQSLGMSGFSNIGCVVESNEKEYIDKIREELPYCMFYVKNFKKKIADLYFTRYCTGAIVETEIKSFDDIEKLQNLDINTIIRKGKIFL